MSETLERAYRLLLESRERKGLETYSESLDSSGVDMREYLLEELADVAMYSARLIRDLTAKTDEDALAWSYLAGLIDGDGSIHFRDRRGKRRHRGLTLTIVLANNDRTLVEFAKRLTRVGSVSLHRGGIQRMDSWQWNVQARQAAGVLQRLLPFLHSKAEQARIGLRYMLQPVGRGRGHTRPGAEEYSQRMREANQKFNQRRSSH